MEINKLLIFNVVDVFINGLNFYHFSSTTKTLKHTSRLHLFQYDLNDIGSCIISVFSSDHWFQLLIFRIVIIHPTFNKFHNFEWDMYTFKQKDLTDLTWDSFRWLFFHWMYWSFKITAKKCKIFPGDMSW